MKFPVTLTRDETDGGFVVTFRDIPEAITQGETVEDALVMAKDALQTAMEFYFEDKRCVPAPSKPKSGQYTIELPASQPASQPVSQNLAAQRNGGTKNTPCGTGQALKHHPTTSQPPDKLAPHHPHRRYSCGTSCHRAAA